MWQTQQFVDLLSIEPPPYLVEGFLRQHTITMVSSEPHLGKTMLMLDLAICMETRTKFLGTFDVPINSSSVILAQDSAKWDVAIQVQKLTKGHNISPQQLAMFDSRIMTRTSSAPKLFDSKFGPWCKHMRQEHGCDVIMLDTHRRFHDSNENDSGEMSAVMYVLENLVDAYGMTVVFNTHTSKPAGFERSTNYSSRGSSVLPGSVDYHYQLRRGKGKTIILDGTAKRRGETQADGDLVLEMKPLNGGIIILPVETQITTSVGDVTKLLSAITATPGVTAKQLASDTGIPYWNVQNYLRNLHTSNRIKRVGRGKWSIS